MLTLNLLLLALIITAGAAFLHGILGFGFPLIAVPIIALFWDIKLAIIVLIIPNLLINFACAIRGNLNNPVLYKQWPIIIYVLIGAFFGSFALVYLNQDVLKLMLAGTIFVFLLQERIERFNFIKRACHHRFAPIGFGLLSGFFSGNVNIGSVPLVIYFVTLELSPIVIGQILNICLGLSKVVQLGSLYHVHAFTPIPAVILIGFSIISLIFIFLGFRMQDKFSLATHRLLLKRTLLVIGSLLLVQVLVTHIPLHVIRAVFI